MDKTQFNFTGEWELYIDSSSVANFGERVKIIFEDDVSEKEEPLNSQIKTYSFVLTALNTIQASISKWCLARSEKLSRMFDVVKSITILMSEKEGNAYFLVNCNRDLQFLFYQNDILYMDALGGKNRSNEKKVVLENGGTIIADHEFVPKKFVPSCKYGKLKPAHQRANEMFEYNLIRYKCNALFKKLVEQHEIDPNKEYKNGKLLASACFYNNNELVSFLLAQGACTDGSFHFCSYWNNNKEALKLLIDNGVDPNYQDDFGKTVLHVQALELRHLYGIKNQRLKGKYETQDVDEKIEDRKKTIEFLIQSGADPTIQNSMNHTPVEVATLFTDELNAEIESCFNPMK